MTDAQTDPSAGPERDFVGYGPQPPIVRWPGGALVAINLVVNYEEGGEYSLREDGINDTWGESSFQYGPQIRDLGTETHMEYGSRVGIWRICRLIDRYQIPATFNACALALERNPPLCAWLRGRDHDVLGHGYHWYGPDVGPGATMTREQERAEIARAVESIERTTGQRVARLDGAVVPDRAHQGAAGRGRRLPLRLRRQQRRASVLGDGAGRPFLVVPYTKVHNDNRYLMLPGYASPRHFTEGLRLSLDYLLEEARAGLGGRLMSVGVHSRWTGQPGRASALRDFIEYATGHDDVAFFRRVDIADFWAATFPPG